MAQSSFAKFIRHDPLTGEEADRRNIEMAADLYRKSEGEMILILPRLVNDEWQAEMARSIGKDLYGKRNT